MANRELERTPIASFPMLINNSLRTRMMLLFCGAVGAILAVSYFGFYSLFARQVWSQLDRQLVETSNPVIADLKSDPTEQDVDQLDVPGNFFEVLDSSGRTVQKSVNLHGHPIPLATKPFDVHHTGFLTVNDPHLGQLRASLISFRRGDQQQVFALAVPTRRAEIALQGVRRIGFLMFPISLLLMAVISRWFVGRSLKPVAELTVHASEAADRVGKMRPFDLWTPLRISNPKDELGRLALTFNELFSRVTSAVRELHQFVSDASHELRTPLTVLRGETELLLAEPRTPEEYQRALRVIEEELTKLGHITEGLFTLALADAGELRIHRQPLYLNEVAEEACSLIQPLARAKDLAIERELSSDVPYLGDEAFLRQLFLIFLDNAIKYSPAGSTIRLAIETQSELIRVVISDRGAGIPAEHLPHIFRRFYRAPSTNSAEARSGGLGLAIATAIAGAHGGRIKCRSQVGVGSTFSVTLPVTRITASPSHFRQNPSIPSEIHVPAAR
jgi:signal transduction histidine kinase